MPQTVGSSALAPPRSAGRTPDAGSSRGALRRGAACARPGAAVGHRLVDRWPRTCSRSRRCWTATRRCAGPSPTRRATARPVVAWCPAVFSGRGLGRRRWPSSASWPRALERERDLTDAVELLAVETVIAAAEAGDRLDAVEDELFRFSRVVTGNPGLRDALSDRSRSAADKEALVGRLVAGKVAPETVRLAAQAVRAPRRAPLRARARAVRRGRGPAPAAADRRRHRGRAARRRAARPARAALSGIYGSRCSSTSSSTPRSIGGIRVQVGDEVVDGTILRRLEDARRCSPAEPADDPHARRPPQHHPHDRTTPARSRESSVRTPN